MADLLRRHIMMQQAGGGSRLPAEYQEVEWIQSANSGDNWIRIGIENDLVSAVSFEFLYFVESWNGSICGLAGAGTRTPGISVDGGNTRLGVSNGWGALYITSTPEEYHTIYMDTSSIVYDGVASACTTCIGFSSSLYKWAVLGTWNNNSRSVRLKGDFLMYDTNGDLFVDLVPCYRKADSMVGYYDIIGDVFHEKTRGNFTVGPDVN